MQTYGRAAGAIVICK